MSEAVEYVDVTAKVARKQPDLPRFIVIQSAALADWALTGTAPVDVAIDGVDVDRRTVRLWTDARCWFMSITQKDCKKLGIDTGSRVTVRLRRAPGVPETGERR